MIIDSHEIGAHQLILKLIVAPRNRIAVDDFLLFIFFENLGNVVIVEDPPKNIGPINCAITVRITSKHPQRIFDMFNVVRDFRNVMEANGEL